MPTFFTLQRHSWLQVVHLELQTFQGAIRVPGLPLVRYQNSDDHQEEQAPTPSNANDGGKSEKTVGIDVKSSWGVFESSSTDLNANTGQGKMKLFWDLDRNVQLWWTIYICSPCA